MGTELIFKIAGVGMVVTVVCQILSRAGRDEQATLVSIGGIVVALLLLAEEIAVLVRRVCEVFGI